MKTNTLIAFFLIYLFVGTKIALCNQLWNVPPDYNIMRPQTFDFQPKRKKDKRSAGEIIRGILNRRQEKMIPPVIEDKIKPPIEYYLDPPRLLQKDKSRLA
tara:strand:- start:63 stop:365 length:303 start_codon:yes stop_codon:yes gene_type:complete